MIRAGGYTAYYSAYARLRLEYSRPLDSADASQMRPGTHSVLVDYVERGGAWTELELVGSAGRRIKWRMPTAKCKFRLMDKLRVRVEVAGTAELRICADGGLLLVDPDGGIHEVESTDDAYELCAHWEIEIRRPTVVGLA